MAAAKLHVDRFLPATPLRIIVDHKRAEVTEQYPQATIEASLQKGNAFKLIENPDLAQNVLPGMVKAAHRTAEKRSRSIIEESLKAMTGLLERELHRLKTLQQVNHHVRPQEIELAEHQKQELANAIQQARVRLDAVRLIWKGPPERRIEGVQAALAGTLPCAAKAATNGARVSPPAATYAVLGFRGFPGPGWSAVAAAGTAARQSWSSRFSVRWSSSFSLCRPPGPPPTRHAKA